jgi:hypothetical protein
VPGSKNRINASREDCQATNSITTRRRAVLGREGHYRIAASMTLAYGSARNRRGRWPLVLCRKPNALMRQGRQTVTCNMSILGCMWPLPCSPATCPRLPFTPSAREPGVFCMTFRFPQDTAGDFPHEKRGAIAEPRSLAIVVDADC